MMGKIDTVGLHVLRWSLVAIFIGLGFYKFTAQEAAGIAPLTTHSPVLFWLNPLLGERGGSNLIGVIEILLGAAMALRYVYPIASAYGGVLTACVLLITFSFLFTTPGLDPASADAGFLLKDIVLFGAALVTAGEAFRAAHGDRH